MGKYLQIKLGAFFGVYFFGWLVFCAFMPIWFKQILGLSGTQIGTIFALNAVVCMMTHPAYGIISDRIGQRKSLLYFITAGMFLTGPFMIFVYAPLLAGSFIVGAVVGAIFLALFFNAGVAAIETFIEKLSRKDGFEFGRVRMWGSLGAAAGIFVAGKVFNVNPEWIFWLSSASAIVLMLVLICIPADNGRSLPEQGNEISIADAMKLFRMRKVWLFMMFIVGSSCVYSVFDQQFGIYYASLFPTVAEGNEAFGMLNSFQVFLEAACMGIAPSIVNRIGAKRGLVLAGMIMAFRVTGSGMVTDTTIISVLKLMHAAELSILIVSIFKYIAAHFDNRLSSVMYLVGFELSSQLGASLISVVAGTLYDWIGFADSYIVLGGIVLIFTMLGIVVLEPDGYERNEAYLDKVK